MYIQFLCLVALGLNSLIPASDASTCMLCGPGNSDLDTAVCEAKDKAIQWLAGQQEKGGSWPSVNTQNAIFALQIADPSWLYNQDLCDRRLTKDRLEFELLQFLMPSACSRCNGGGSSSGGGGGVCCVRKFERGAGVLGQYMLALQSVCCETDNFYTADLNCLMVQLLKDFPEDNFNNFFQFSLAILSLCSQGSGTPIFKKALQKLADGPNDQDTCDTTFDSVDILSMEVMAMVCARDQAMGHNLDDWEDIVNARVQCIQDSQNENCSFNGSAITTALALQALSAAGTTPYVCSCEDTMLWLLSQQTDDGDFGGVGATAQILPILNCNNFGSLLDVSINCPNFPEPPAIQPSDPTETFDIQVKVGDDVESYRVTIIEGENLYYGMLRLDAIDSDFTFQSSETAFGQSVDVINGVSDDAAASLFWTIRVGDENTYADQGISGLEPMDGDLYIFVLQDFSSY